LKPSPGLAQALGASIPASASDFAGPCANIDVADQKRLDAQAFLMFGTVCELLDVCRAASLAAGATAASATWLFSRLRGHSRSRHRLAGH